MCLTRAYIFSALVIASSNGIGVHCSPPRSARSSSTTLRPERFKASLTSSAHSSFRLPSAAPGEVAWSGMNSSRRSACSARFRFVRTLSVSHMYTLLPFSSTSSISFQMRQRA